MKKWICLLLVLSCLAVCFAACNGKNNDPAPTGTSSGNGSGEPENPGQNVPEKDYNSLEKVDFDNKEFHILTRDSAGTVLWKPIDWTSDGEDQADIPQAVYRRNEKVEQDYHCFIVQKEVENQELLAAATMAYIGQTGDYDAIVMPVALQMASMAVNGYYKDLSTLNHLSVSDPWWNAKTNDSLSLLGHYYTLCGDINIVDDLATWCVMVNKFIVNDWGIESPYTTVENGNWTLETMFQNAALVSSETHDPYGSGMYGVATEFDVMNAYLASAGLTTVKVVDGVLVNNTKSHIFESAFSKIYDYMKNENVQVFGDNVTDGSGGYNAINWGALSNTFVGDQALYMTGTLSNLIGAQFAKMTSPFGVLPMPKFTSEQTEYVGTFQIGNATTVSILENQTNAEDVALLLSAMSALSVTTLTPAFYQQTLYGRKVPDPESVPMMDMIINSRTVDIGIVMSTQARSILNESIKNRESYSFVDVRTKYASSLEEGLETITNAVKNNFQKTETPAN